MSTEIATRDMTIPDPAGTGNAASAALVAWAEGLAAAHRIASALCGTAFAPAHFKGKPEEAAAAILYGAEIGFTPTQALANLYVIGGKPAMYARPMVALVQGAGHEVWTEEKTDESVTVCGRRRGSKHITRETWTTQRAQRAGYTTNKKYQTDPQAMLYARAASDVCRQIAADVLAGIGHSVEEMELAGQDVSQSRATPPAAPQTYAAPVDPGVAITDEQVADLVALMTRKGITGAARLAGTRHIIGRDIESLDELTEAEHAHLVDALASRADVEAGDQP